MHSTVQSGGRSPKSLNGSASSQQLKSGSETVNNSTSLPSHVKGKKRERGDQAIHVNEPIKRERSAKTEDNGSVNIRLDRMIKAEIAKITDKGGVTNPDGVDKLVHLMQLVRADRKSDIAGRVLLANVIAATDRNDCLGRFVQLRGFPVLDGWLQEAHKWKTGDGTSPKENDKDVEELLFALLRALDKLPVSLNVLQTCHIGKSVNHLRNHKNLEIQKKSRSLVETWKKRVDAEIKKNEVKSVGASQVVQWPGKQGFSEAPNALNRRATFADVTLKTSTAQPSTYRDLPGMPGHADATAKSAPVTAGSLKLPPPLPATAAISAKESTWKAGSSGNADLPAMIAKEEKSSSSSQSQNSQSCSSGNAKAMSSTWKEDTRSSSPGSVNVTKTSGVSTRHLRSGNGFPGTSVSGLQKESNLAKSGSLVRTITSDKVPQGASICEKTLDMPDSDKENNHKLIVRLANPGRSPLQSAGGGSCVGQSVSGSRGSSPTAIDKQELSDLKAIVKDDQTRSVTDFNADSQSNKGELARSDAPDCSPATTSNDKRQNAEETEKAADASRAICPLLRKEGFPAEPKPRDSFSSMNALIESCVKYSEASVPISAGDDIGMNLLASVATGEMSKSGIHSPKSVPGSLAALEKTSAGNNEVKSKLAYEDGITQRHGQFDENRDIIFEKHGKPASDLLARDMSEGGSGDKNTSTLLQGNKSIVQYTGPHLVSCSSSRKVEDSGIKSEEEVEKLRDRKKFVCIAPDAKEEHDDGFHHQDKRKIGDSVIDSSSDCKLKVNILAVDENNASDLSCEKAAGCEKIEDMGMKTSNFICGSPVNISHNEMTAKRPEQSIVADCSTINNEVPSSATSIKQQLTSVAENAENEDRSADAGASSCADDVVFPDRADSKSRNSESMQTGHLEHIDCDRKDISNSATSTTVERTVSDVTPPVTTDEHEELVERKAAPENHPAGSRILDDSPTFQVQEADKSTKTTGSKFSGADADGRDELASSAEVSLVVNSVSKLDFDLNEGIPGDDVSASEPVTSAVRICASVVHPPCVSSFSSSPTSNGSHAPITVAAPAKGSFVPPENMLRKPQPGWKGSAATSAFRPAEPRKILEMPLTASEVPSEAAGGKNVRPLLDIDLNVADEGVLEDVASPSSVQTTGSESGVICNRGALMQSSGGLDLDLNRIDEGAEYGQFLASTSHRLDPLVFLKNPSSGGLLSGDTNLFRDFDLNNGPGLDEVQRSQNAKTNTSVPFLPPAAGLRMNNPEVGSVSSWFPPGNSYPAVAIPSFLPDRGEQPYPVVAAAGTQRIMGSVNGGGIFGGEMYRGPILSSSPAMGFAPATAFPYASFQYASSVPVASTSYSGVSATYVDPSSGGVPCFPAIPSTLVGQGGAISSQYPRPYVFNLPEGNTSGGSDSSRRWAKHLDLNAGPGTADGETRDDRFSVAPRQLSISSSQAFIEEQNRLYQLAAAGPRSADGDVRDDRFSAAPRQLSISSSQAFIEEQNRLYQLAGGGLKRKDPEGGWDAERFVGYMQQHRQ